MTGCGTLTFSQLHAIQYRVAQNLLANQSYPQPAGNSCFLMLHCLGGQALVYSCRHICADAVSHYVLSGTLYAFCCASNTSLPVAEIPNTRPPTAAMLFAASLAVPAWNTCKEQNFLPAPLVLNCYLGSECKADISCQRMYKQRCNK